MTHTRVRLPPQNIELGDAPASRLAPGHPEGARPGDVSPDGGPAPVVLPRSVRPRSVRPRLMWLASVVVLAGAYFAVGKAGLAATALPGNVTPVWPPTGLALAALLLGGFRLWPGVAAGALLVNGLSAVPFFSAVGMAGGNTLEAVVGAWLFSTLTLGDRALGRVRDVLAFVVGAAMFATTLSASFGVFSLRAGGVIPTDMIWSTWRVWWVGDALGALVFAPLLLSWLPERQGLHRPALSRRDGAEVAAFIVVGGGLTRLICGAHFDHPYVVFPALIWASLHWRQRGATSLTLVISIVAVLDTRAGHGAFHAGTTTHSVWLLATFLAMVAVTGLVLAAVVRERDAQAARNAELTAALRHNVAELEYANKELEAFAYSVSHDLRAPLRNIDGFSRNLLKLHGAGLDDEAQRFLARIRANAKSMGTLIDELLAFSRLQRQPLTVSAVSLNEVVGDAIELLDAARADRDVEISVAALPTVTADRGLLVQVYVNLIGNALKFTRERAAAHITVGLQADSSTGQPVFFVRDDGVGFDMDYVDKMFGVFQRLHRMEDYEGSGVGLALVARIVNRHGGRVWAEGAVDKGATLHFTLGEAKT